MKKNQKKNVVLCLAILGSAMLSGGVIGLEKKAVQAVATPLSISEIQLQMDVGASVRLQTSSDDTAKKNNGLRFGTYLSQEDYVGLMANVGEGKAYEKVEFGMLIAPSNYELTKANVFGNEAIYDWATYNADEEIWQYDDSSNKTRIINITGTEVIDYAISETETVKLFTGSIVNVKEENLTNEFQGVGYIAYTTASGTDYLFAIPNDNVRSMTYVAQRFAEIVQGTEIQNSIIENYVAPVSNLKTTYTVEHRAELQDGTQSVLQAETKRANIGGKVTETPLSGYTLSQTESKTESTVYANGKTQLLLQYSYTPETPLEYRILLSETPTQAERVSAEELAYFYREATGLSLPIVESATANANGYYISIGDTNLYKENPVSNLSSLGDSGYSIRTIGNSYVLNANGENGKTYASYGFLEEVFGLEIYEKDVFSFSKTVEGLPQTLSVSETPDFEYRSASGYKVDNDGVSSMRLRFNGTKGANGVETPFSKTLNSHSFFTLLPTSYYEEHNDWFYVVDGNLRQICLSKMLTDNEMYSVVLGNMKKYITDEPNAYYFMFGFMDYGSASHCTCTNCTNYGNAINLYIDATNKLAEDVHSWLVAEGNSRADKVKIGMFAYVDLINPPSSGAHTLSDYAYVYFAPIGTAYDYSADAYSWQTTSYNSTIKTAMSRWKKIAKYVMVWSYSSSFCDYIAPFNDIENAQSWFKAYLNMNAIRMMTQGARETETVSFGDLRFYIFSKLMWDVNADVEELKTNFFNAYYQGVSSEMLSYYNTLTAKLNALKNQDYATATVQNSIYKAECWSESELTGYYTTLKSILSKTENNRAVYERVLKETLFVRFALLEFYANSFDTETYTDELLSLEEDARNCGCTYFVEGWYSYNTSTVYKLSTLKSNATVREELLSRLNETENYADASNIHLWSCDSALSFVREGEYKYSLRMQHAKDSPKLSLSGDVIRKAVEKGYSTLTYTAVAPSFNFWLNVQGGTEEINFASTHSNYGKNGVSITQEIKLSDLYNPATGEYSLWFTTAGWWSGCSMYLTNLTFGNRTNVSASAGGETPWEGQADFFIFP